jgi:NTE family protein
MALGRADTLAMRAEVCQFFGWTDTGAEVQMRHHT